MYWRRDCGPPSPALSRKGVRGFFVSMLATDETSMSRENIAHVPPRSELTEEEAVTLRRVAFGESDERSLRQADLERLLALRLIVAGRDGPVLTASGREAFNSLPRPLFAARPR